MKRIGRVLLEAAIWIMEHLLCLLGRHDEVALRRATTRGERRRLGKADLAVYGKVCRRCGKVTAGSVEEPKPGTL